MTTPAAPGSAPDLPLPSDTTQPKQIASGASQRPSAEPEPVKNGDKPYFLNAREKNRATRLLASGVSQQAVAKVIERGVGTINRLAAQAENGIQAIASTAAQFDADSIRRLEALTSKQLDYYDQALDQSLVNPSTIPLGYGILMTKRSELLSEARQLVPIGTNASPESFLSDLLKEPEPAPIEAQLTPA